MSLISQIQSNSSFQSLMKLDEPLSGMEQVVYSINTLSSLRIKSRAADKIIKLYTGVPLLEEDTWPDLSITLYNLGVWYLQCSGKWHLESPATAPDKKKALKYFKHASSLGNHEAQMRTGWFHYYVTKNPLLANRYFSMAIKQADEGSFSYLNSQFYLGCIYLKGYGVEKDLKKALSHLKRADDQEDLESLVARAARITLPDNPLAEI